MLKYTYIYIHKYVHYKDRSSPLPGLLHFE